MPSCPEPGRVTPEFLDLFSPAQPAAQPQQAPEGAPGGPLGTVFAALDRSAAAVSARAYEDRMWGKCLRWAELLHPPGRLFEAQSSGCSLCPTQPTRCVDLLISASAMLCLHS